MKIFEIGGVDYTNPYTAKEIYEALLAAYDHGYRSAWPGLLSLDLLVKVFEGFGYSKHELREIRKRVLDTREPEGVPTSVPATITELSNDARKGEQVRQVEEKNLLARLSPFKRAQGGLKPEDRIEPVLGDPDSLPSTDLEWKKPENEMRPSILQSKKEYAALSDVALAKKLEELAYAFRVDPEAFAKYEAQKHELDNINEYWNRIKRFF